MHQERFYPGEEPLVENLENLRDSLGKATRERVSDIQKYGILRTPGQILVDDALVVISTEFPLGVNGSDPKRLDVGLGVAYTSNNERIVVSTLTPYDNSVGWTNSINLLTAGVSTPASTGNVGINLPTSSIGSGAGTNYIWIDYLLAIDATQWTVDPDLGQNQYTKAVDGYQIVPTTTLVPPTTTAILLGSVATLAGGNVDPTSLNLSGRVFSSQAANTVAITTSLADGTDKTTTYTNGLTTTLDQHIKAVGTGTVSSANPHGIGVADVSGLSDLLGAGEPLNALYQKETHSDGIVSAGKTGLVITVNGPATAIDITPLTSGEALYIAGRRFDSLSPKNPLTIDGIWRVDFTTLLSDPVNPYYIYVYADPVVTGGLLAAAGTSAPSGSFILGSVLYVGGILQNSSLKDYRIFGTTQSSNLASFFTGALSTGTATGNITTSFSYTGSQLTSSTLAGDVSGTITYNYGGGSAGTSVSGTGAATTVSPGDTLTINLNGDGAQTITFATGLTTGADIASTIQALVRGLTANIIGNQPAYDNFTTTFGSALYTLTSGTIGATSTAVVTGGSAASTLKLGTLYGTETAGVTFNSSLLTSVVAKLGNRTLTTTFAYVDPTSLDSLLTSMAETVTF